MTEDEIRELKNIYEQFDVIGEKILGDDDNLTDEELESRFSKYESEWNELEQKAETLEKKHGENKSIIWKLLYYKYVIGNLHS